MENTEALKAAKDAVTKLDKTGWDDFQIWMIEEKDRRHMQPVVQKAQADLIRQEREEGDRTAPKKPEAPTTADDFDAWQTSGVKYIRGDRVHVDGKVYESMVEGINPFTPGEWGAGDAWRDITADLLAGKAEEAPAQKEWNSSAHYDKGDVVSWEGKRYQATDEVQPGELPPDGNPKKFERI